MRKLFFLLLVIASMTVSCGPDSVDRRPDPVLTLTSDAIINFGVDGGTSEIAYTLDNAVADTAVVVVCDAEWIDAKVFGEECKVSLIVASYDGYDEREAIIVVSYGVAQSFEVVVKQAGNEFDGYELSYVAGTYYEPGYWAGEMPNNHNYFLTLSNVDDFTTYAPNGAYLELDLWAATGGADVAVPAGEYVLSLNDSGAPGTIACSYTRFIEMDANQAPVVWILPIEGKVVVGDNKLEGYLVGEYGDKVTFRYSGSLKLSAE